MVYKVIKKYEGAIVGRESEGVKDKNISGGWSFTFECNGNGCSKITLSKSFIETLPNYFKKIG